MTAPMPPAIGEPKPTASPGARCEWCGRRLDDPALNRTLLVGGEFKRFCVAGCQHDFEVWIQ
jgi:hypothetical protein